jgi:hypothetical protein
MLLSYGRAAEACVAWLDHHKIPLDEPGNYYETLLTNETRLRRETRLSRGSTRVNPPSLRSHVAQKVTDTQSSLLYCHVLQFWNKLLKNERFQQEVATLTNRFSL